MPRRFAQTDSTQKPPRLSRTNKIGLYPSTTSTKGDETSKGDDWWLQGLVWFEVFAAFSLDCTSSFRLQPSSYVFLLDPNHVFVTFLVLGLDVNSLGLLDMTRYSWWYPMTSWYPHVIPMFLGEYPTICLMCGTKLFKHRGTHDVLGAMGAAGWLGEALSR